MGIVFSHKINSPLTFVMHCHYTRFDEKTFWVEILLQELSMYFGVWAYVKEGWQVTLSIALDRLM